MDRAAGKKWGKYAARHNIRQLRNTFLYTRPIATLFMLTVDPCFTELTWVATVMDRPRNLPLEVHCRVAVPSQDGGTQSLQISFDELLLTRYPETFMAMVVGRKTKALCLWIGISERG